MIRYSFTFGTEATFRFDVDRGSDTCAEQSDVAGAQWLALEYEQCSFCAVPPGSRKTCPAALAMKPVVEAFDHRLSFETVHVVVDDGDRGKLEAELSVQRAVRSLLGLLLALSSCPVMRKLRPMAHYHLPFGSREHTSFRFVGMYLFGQHLRDLEGQTPDWRMVGLRALFAELRIAYRQLARRLRGVIQEDAVVNGLIYLDTFISAAELDLEEFHEANWPLFSAYLDPKEGD